MTSRQATNALRVLSFQGTGACLAASMLLGSHLVPGTASAQGPALPSLEGLAAADSGKWARVYEHALPGVVYILSEGLCSGALVDVDLVLTAWHCVEGGRALRVGYDKETRRKGRYDFEDGVVVAAADKRNDLAVLRLPSNAKGSMRILRLADARYVFRPGNEVATIGHPVGLSPLTPTGLQESQLNVLTRGPLAKVNPELVVADLLVLPGNSGGPVFDEKGDIVGIVSARHRDGDLGYFVPVARLHAVVADAKARGPGSPPINRQPLLGSDSLRIHAAMEADRYAAQLFGGTQNIYTLSPSLTLLGRVRGTWTTRVGPQTVRKRQWDVTFLTSVEVSRLLDIELGLGGGQVFYSHERTGASRQSALIKGLLGAAGAQVSFQFPTEDLIRPTFAFGLDILDLL